MDRRATWGLLALATVVRAVQALIHHPWWTADSLLYAVVSERLQRGAWWAENDAGRPPLYPLLLASAQALGGGEPAVVPSAWVAEGVVALQGAGWVGVVWLTADAARRWGAPRGVWLAVGGLLALADASATLERALQPMSLAALCLAAWAWLLSGLQTPDDGLPHHRRLLYAGTCLGLACLLRTEALVLGGAWALASWRRGLGAALPLAAALPWVGALSAANGLSAGYWGPSVLVDLNASCPVWDQWDGAAPEDALAGAILADLGGRRVDGVMDAFGALAAAAPDLPVDPARPVPTAVAAYVGEASRRLWVRRPAGYLGNVGVCLSGAWRFVEAPPAPLAEDPRWVGGPGVYRGPVEADVARVWAAIGRVGWGIVAGLVGVAAIRGRPFALALVAVLAAHCFLAAWFPRYGATFLPIAVLAAAGVVGRTGAAEGSPGRAGPGPR